MTLTSPWQNPVLASLSKMIVYAWVNDEDSKRACQSNYDAYRVFREMLESGHPPDDWDRLQSEAEKEALRMRKAMASATAPPG